MKNIMKILSVFIGIFLFTFSYAQEVKMQRLREPNPDTQVYYGDSGDIDGDVAVVVSVHNHTAYVYDLNSSGDWVLSKSIIPEDASWGDRFGQGACAISGKYVIVGDWMNTSQKIGAAYIFELGEGSEWKQMVKLKPISKDTAKSFGVSVAIYGKTALVGSYNGVYVFELGADNEWKQTQFIDEKPLKASLGYRGVCLNEKYMVLGTGYIYIDKNIGYNAALVYERNNGQWELMQKIMPPNDQHDSKFGKNISISGNTIAVSAYGQNFKSFGSSGAVFVYQLKGKKFEMSQEIYPMDFGQHIYNFGFNIAMSDNYLAVLRAQEENYKGSVIIYKKIDGEFDRIYKKISPINSSSNGNNFGNNGVAISNNKIFVGAPGDSYCDEDDSMWTKGACGSAFMFTVEE